MMVCTLKVHPDIIRNPIAYKYYVLTQSTMKDETYGFEDLQVHPKFGKHVNRRLVVDKSQKGTIN